MMRSPRPEFVGLTPEEIKARLKAEKAEYDRAYRKTNADKIRAQKLLDNKSEAAKARKAKYRETHREMLRAQGRKYAFQNRGRMSEYAKEFRKNNRDKINFWALKRWAAKLNRTPKWLTETDWNAIESLYLEAVRRTETEGIRYEVDHIIPLQGKLVSGLHVPTNLRVIPKSENAAKRNHYRVE